MNVRMTVPWRFPLRHVLRLAHKPASRTGKAHWFLSDPTASSRHCCQARWCWIPQRLHTPTPDIRAGQRPNESDQHCDESQNLPAHSRRTSNPPNPVNAFAQVIPVGAGPCQDLGDPGFGLSSVAARTSRSVSYTHLRAHETDSYLVCRLLLEKKKKDIIYKK